MIAIAAKSHPWLTNMVDGIGTTKYAYAVGGQLWTEDGPWASDTVTNTYNRGLRTGLGLLQPTGAWTNGFDYDAANRLTNLTSPAGAFGYSLGAAGGSSPLLQKLSLPNTSYITNTYDSVARLLSTKLNKSDHTTLDAADYGYDPGHQRTAFTNAANTFARYTYDAIGQLKVVRTTNSSGTKRCQSQPLENYVPGLAWSSPPASGPMSSLTMP